MAGWLPRLAGARIQALFPCGIRCKVTTKKNPNRGKILIGNEIGKTGNRAGRYGLVLDNSSSSRTATTTCLRE